MKAKQPVLLSDQTLENAFREPDAPLGPLSKFIFYSKYSRWREDMKRREYWSETCQRSVEYNINLAIAHAEENGIDTPELREFHRQELEAFYANQRNLRQFLSGRTLWTGGTQASYLNPMSNYNCSFIVIDEWRKLAELMHLGMVGTGIGFRILFADIDKLAKIKNRKWEIEHQPIETLTKEQRQDNTVVDVDNATITITIGDSKEGWSEAINSFFDALTSNRQITKISFNYDHIRPKGERLKRFGGRAGGPETIKAMFDKFHKILNGQLTEGYPKIYRSGKVKPLHVLDLANAIGKNIQSGGVRSIAEIALLDPEDQETMGAKSNIFDKPQLNHRFVSNNSVFYEDTPSDEQLDWQFKVLEYDGEPCFVNAVVAKRRRTDFKGVNPCVEILLADRGLCNLTTINMMAFVKDGVLLLDELLEAQAMSARAGLRMTLPRLELREWDEVQQRDRLLGVSVTGWMDAMDAIGYNREQQVELMRQMKDVARNSADEYADILGINRPLLVTAVKPEGTISQLAGGVSSGLHTSHAKDYLRRVRSMASDPISNAVFDLGWRMHAEFQDGSQLDQIKDLAQYIPWMDIEKDENIQPARYEYHQGKLSVEFEVKVKDGEKYADIHNSLNRMVNAYYEGKASKPITMLDYETGKATITYEVHNPTYSMIFGKSTKVVVDFPISTTAKRTKFDVSAIEQLEVYKDFLHNYTEHNPSNTINVRPEEWGDVKQWVKDNWDDMLAVSFLTLFDAPYPLLPYNACPRSEVDYLKSTMQDFDPLVLMKYDLGDDMELVEAGCEGMGCPVR